MTGVTERNTRQRDAIRQVFQAAARPLSPLEVHLAATKVVKRLSIATVYRAIHFLLDEGELVLVRLPGEPARYELGGQDHHHHFWCWSCDRVFDIPGCSALVEHHAPRGFQVEAHEVTLYGRCPSCGKERGGRGTSPSARSSGPRAGSAASRR